MESEVLIDVLESDDKPISSNKEQEEMERYFSRVELTSDPEILELSSPDTDITLSLRINSFDDEKQLTRFIKSCEYMVRKSPEYRLWKEYIKETLGLTKCEITGEYSNQTGIEVHHHPITLYHIIEAIVSEKIAREESFCTFDIAVDTIKMHFENRLGFIPLVETIHQKYHNGFIEIPMELVSGNYKYFVDNYMRYLDEKTKEYITAKIGINKNNCGWTTNWTNNSYPAPRLQDENQQESSEG